MLFSATMTEEVKELAALSLQRPVRLAADPRLTAPKQLTQEVVRIQVILVMSHFVSKQTVSGRDRCIAERGHFTH